MKLLAQCLVLLIFVGTVAVALRSAARSDTTEAKSPLKLCAQALVTLSLAAECTALNSVNNSCAFTLGDLREVREAGAAKQNYCPVDHTDGSANQ